jgi:cytosine/creatinine deaminase
VPVDFHIDFDLDPRHTNLPAVIAITHRLGWQGRVSVGHVTNLSAMSEGEVLAIADQLASAGIALAVLPATDLFLNGRAYDRLVPRGVAPAHLLAAQGVVTSIASNNILNPFTPYGDASLIRMANLYANVAQLSRDADLSLVFEMVTSSGQKRGLGGRLAVGGKATIVLIDSDSRASAVREVARVIAGWKDGRKTFDNGWPQLYKPLKKGIFL